MFYKIGKLKSFILIIVLMVCGFGRQNIFAQTPQTSQSSLYVPLIGITSVPEPLALPAGPGNVTYHYAVKNFLQEIPLTDIQVVDDTCGTVKFVEGDDNGNGKLDFSETWRYTCATRLSTTTQSSAVATGLANNIAATHKAYATVVVGSSQPAPLVSIVNITKVAYPLSLPIEGGSITYTYKVNNPGVVPLSDVRVIDDKCNAMSGKLGDTNGNNLLDTNEVWIYTCTMSLKQTTTNTVTVRAFANGLSATDSATLTVKVETPSFPETGSNPNIKTITWGTLLAILIILIALFFLMRQARRRKTKKKGKSLIKVLLILVVAVGVMGAGYYFILSHQLNSNKVVAISDKLFGWKFPVAKFPLTGSSQNQIAYSDIRDPGGIPQGLPVRLKIPFIGVDSAIEDALITPDGRMDVPAGSVNVAWFALGPHPGKVGSAVIGGHFGISNGKPFVFYNLDKLKTGDKIYILDDKGETLAFQIRKIRSFDRNADATTVFTSNDGLAHLNLITCEGTWNRVNGNYPLRLVVFADKIASEGAIVVKPYSPVAARPKLPSTAIVTPEATLTVSPSIISPQESPEVAAIPIVSSKILTQSAKTLFATPTDGLATSILLVSIGFVLVRIIWLWKKY